MTTTTLEIFRKELLSAGVYSSPAERRAAVRAKPSALATLRFSWNLLRVFPVSGMLEAQGKLSFESWAEVCFRCVQCAERLGMGVQLDGFAQRQAYSGPVMYLCNHISTYETILLPPVLLTYGPFNIVAKSSLVHIPLLEKAAAHMGMVGVTRKNPKADLMTLFEVGSERIRSGNSFLIFPQGTREPVFSRKRFSSIGAKLAERAGCPIVPLAVDTRCQPRRDRGLLKHVFRDFGPLDTSMDIRLSCGPVIPCGKAREMHEASFDWIAGRLEAWGMPVER